MKIKWRIFNRKVHYWGAMVCAIPIIIIIVTGMLLLFKKQSDWIQPQTQIGYGKIPTISFNKIIDIITTHPKLKISSWEDVKRLDVRPNKGIIKIQSQNSTEIQMDHQTGKILQISIRRSDLIESIHDGSFFHKHAKLWIFFPSAIILLILWITGIYLFLLPYFRKKKSV